MYRLLVSCLLVMGMLCSQIVQSDEKMKKYPSHKKMSKSKMTLDDNFSSFHKELSPMESLLLILLLGYASKMELFSDFFQSLTTNYDYDDENNVQTIEDTTCEGENGNESEGVIKLTFDCSGDGVIYSCYADLIDNNYSISIPSQVEGLSCKISVEAGKMNSSETDFDVNGVTTSEEVDLDDGESVVIDISKDE